MIFETFRRLADKPAEHWARRFGSFGAIPVLVVAVALAFFSHFPNYAESDSRHFGSLVEFPPTPLGQAIEWWLDHPFSAVPVERFFPPDTLHLGSNEGFSSHCDKLTFRATLPLLNQVVGGGVWTLVAACHVAGILTFAFVFTLVRRHANDPVAAAFVTWAFAASWAGSSAFSDFVFGDSVAVCLLMAAAVTTHRGLVFASLLAAGFTDERAVTAAALVALYHFWRLAPPLGGGAPGRAPSPRSFLLPVASALAAYALIRLVLSQSLGLSTGGTMMATFAVFRFHFATLYPLRILEVFEGLWLPALCFTVALALAHGVRSKPFLLFAACLGLAAGPAFLVYDADRSLTYLLPGVLCAFCFLPAAASHRRMLAVGAFLVSLLWLAPPRSALRFGEPVVALVKRYLQP